MSSDPRCCGYLLSCDPRCRSRFVSLRHCTGALRLKGAPRRFLNDSHDERDTVVRRYDNRRTSSSAHDGCASAVATCGPKGSKSLSNYCRACYAQGNNENNRNNVDSIKRELSTA